MATAVQKPDAPEDLDHAVEEAIAMSAGDMREAIRGLILGQRSLHAEIARTVSAGYVRRRAG